MRFEKWQALGNDYVIVEADDLPWELTPERIRRICAAPLRDRLRRHPAALARRRPRLRRRASDLQPGRLGGRALGKRGSARPRCTCAPAAGPTRTSSRSSPRPGAIRPTITGPDTATLEMGRASVTSPDFPSGGADGAGTLSAGGREWRFQHVSIGNPQCVIDAGRGARGARPRRRSAPRSSTAPCSRTAPTSRSSASTGPRCERGSSSAGWGRRSPPGPAPAAPPWRPPCAALASPITVVLDGGELDRRDIRGARGAAQRNRRAGLPRRALRGPRAGARRSLIGPRAGRIPCLPRDDHVRDQAPAGRSPRGGSMPCPRTCSPSSSGESRRSASGDRRDQPRDRRPGPRPPTRTWSRRCRPPSPTPPTTATRRNRGRAEFRHAFADFYDERFGVEIDADSEVIPAIGAKECIYNLCFAFLDPGDVALAADPGYPVYTGGPALAGAEAGAAAAAPGAGLRARPGRDPDRRPGPRPAAVRQLPEQPHRRGGPGRLLRAAGRARPRARDPDRPRQRLLGDDLRRIRRAELSRHPGRQGGRGRGVLALEGLQHDRLALRGDPRQRRRDRVVLAPQDERRLWPVRSRAARRRGRALRARGVRSRR